jgi:hypothetical protein
MASAYSKLLRYDGLLYISIFLFYLFLFIEAVQMIEKSLTEHRTDEAVKKQKEIQDLKRKQEEEGLKYNPFV